MSKNRPKITKKDKKTDADFATIGEPKKIKPRKTPHIEEKTIIDDGRQYSCKIPRKLLQLVGFKKGAKLKFKVTYSDDLAQDPKLEIEYLP